MLAVKNIVPTIMWLKFILWELYQVLFSFAADALLLNNIHLSYISHNYYI